MEDISNTTPSHYQRYKESIKASVSKHYQNHRAEKNAYFREYQKKLYSNNPEFREMKKAKSLERYYKKKAEAATLNV